MAREEKGQDEAPAIITDHAYVPRAEWWTLCKICSLAEAAHAESTIDTLAEIRKSRIGYYSDDNPDDI